MKTLGALVTACRDAGEIDEETLQLWLHDEEGGLQVRGQADLDAPGRARSFS